MASLALQAVRRIRHFNAYDASRVARGARLFTTEQSSSVASFGRKLAQFSLSNRTAELSDLNAQEPASLEDAYHAQDAGVIENGRSGHSIKGWKIGATNDAAMKRMNLPEPFLGPLYKRNILSAASPSGEHVLGRDQYSGFTLRGVEVEWAAVMKRDLPLDPTTAPLTIADVLRAVDYFAPAVEVCGSRLKKPSASAFVSIADQASHGLLLVGAENQRIAAPAVVPSVKHAQEWADANLNGWSVALLEGGGREPVARGSGRDVLNTGPLTALTWLANVLAGRSIAATPHTAAMALHLKAGDTITTGTMTGLTPVTLMPNKHVHPFGMAEASFEAIFTKQPQQAQQQQAQQAQQATMKLSVAFLR